MTVGELIEMLSVLPDDMPVVVSGTNGGEHHIGMVVKDNKATWPRTSSVHRCETGRCEVSRETEWIDVPAHIVLSPPWGPGDKPSIRRGDTPPVVERKGNWPKPKEPSFEPPLPRRRAR